MVVPPRFKLSSVASFAAHPRWTWEALLQRDFGLANVAHRVDSAKASSSVMDFINSQFDRTVTWDDVAWLVDQWRGPFVIRVCRAGRRKRAVGGATAVMISNGGRQLDSTPAPVDCIARMRDVGDRSSVVDGGIRRHARQAWRSRSARTHARSTAPAYVTPAAGGRASPPRADVDARRGRAQHGAPGLPQRRGDLRGGVGGEAGDMSEPGSVLVVAQATRRAAPLRVVCARGPDRLPSRRHESAQHARRGSGTGWVEPSASTRDEDHLVLAARNDRATWRPSRSRSTTSARLGPIVETTSRVFRSAWEANASVDFWSAARRGTCRRARTGRLQGATASMRGGNGFAVCSRQARTACAVEVDGAAGAGGISRARRDRWRDRHPSLAEKSPMRWPSRPAMAW